MLPDKSVLIGQKLAKMPKFKNSNETFWVIFKQCEDESPKLFTFFSNCTFHPKQEMWNAPKHLLRNMEKLKVSLKMVLAQLWKVKEEVAISKDFRTA